MQVKSSLDFTSVWPVYVMGDNNAYREFSLFRIEIKLQVLKSLKHTLNIQNFQNFFLKYPLESLLIKFVLFGAFRYSLLSLNALTSSFVLSWNLDAIWYKRNIVLAILP